MNTKRVDILGYLKVINGRLVQGDVETRRLQYVHGTVARFARYLPVVIGFAKQQLQIAQFDRKFVVCLFHQRLELLVLQAQSLHNDIGYFSIGDIFVPLRRFSR